MISLLSNPQETTFHNQASNQTNKINWVADSNSCAEWWALQYLQVNNKAIIYNWLTLLESNLPPAYQNTNVTELTQICQVALHAICVDLNPNQNKPHNLLSWALDEQDKHQADIVDILKFISTLRTTLINRFDASSFVNQLNHNTSLTSQSFMLIDAILNDALITITSTFTKLSNKAVKQQITQLQEIALQSASVTEEADRALVQLQSLYDISRQLSSSLNIKQIMNQIAVGLTEHTYAHSTTVWMLENNILTIQAFHSIGFDDPGKLSIPLTEEKCPCVVLKTLNQQQAAIIQSTEHDPAKPLDQWLLNNFKATILLAIPLSIQNECIGLITLHSINPKLHLDLDLAKATAQQAAIFIQNGQLYQKVQHLNRTLEQRITARTQALVAERDRVHKQSISLEEMLHIQQIESSQKEAILTSIVDGVIASDHSGYIILSNPAAEKILNTVLLGYALTEIFTSFEPEGQQEILEYLTTCQNIIQNNQPIPSKLKQVILKNNQHIIKAQITVATTSSNQAIGIVVVLRDISKEVN